MSAPTPRDTPPAGAAPVDDSAALPPETLEGWYALHQLFIVDRAGLRARRSADRERMLERFARTVDGLREPDGGGWTILVPLVGSPAELMLVHLRPTLEALEDVQRSIRAEPLHDHLQPRYTFLSVTEAGLYHLTAKLAAEAGERGGSVGDEEYQSELARRVAEERETPFLQRRLEPNPPPELPYVCFYPMSKRRDAQQNWYTLALEERSRLMYAHGRTGRKYAGEVLQIITGAIGLAEWEWGVTLFARDPLTFKKLVTEMRFDEVSAKYAEFGMFYVGRVRRASEWVAELRL